MKKETTSATASGVATKVKPDVEPLFDLDGLMTDFPTAKELEKFVYDKTGLVLELKGRSNKFKYQTALDVLNGQTPDPVLLGTENPYLDKNDIVPVDKPKQVPPAPQHIRGHIPVNQFQCSTFPHPDTQFAATGQKCDVIFRQYTDKTITYEVLGPVAMRAVGNRINKYGKDVPDKYEWVDPRTGEQIIRWPDGRVTPLGTRLKNYMSKLKVGDKTQWETWIDRDFVIGGSSAQALDNPWNI